jgi:hypothetical protein
MLAVSVGTEHERIPELFFEQSLRIFSSHPSKIIILTVGLSKLQDILARLAPAPSSSAGATLRLKVSIHFVSKH